MIKKFRLTQPYDGNEAGAILYESAYYDYGLANDDTRSTGIEHISVTHDDKGGHPSFTCPEHLLELISD